MVLQIWEDEHLFWKRPKRREFRILSETLAPYSYQINRFQVRTQSQHSFDRSHDLTLELLRSFDSEVEDIRVASFRGERPAIYLRHRRLGLAPLSVFGDAMRRAVLLASTLPTLSGGVLLIDEVEAGIHISGLRDVFAWVRDAARQFEVQIIVTTHSLEAVDAIIQTNSGSADDIVTFHLEQTSDRTIAKRISGELLMRLRTERGLDVR